MQENTISWTIPNTITVTLMVFITFTVAALLWNVVKRARTPKPATDEAAA